MSLPRPLKVRRTDYRQPSAGKPSPLERGTARPEAAAWDRSDARSKQEAANHDAWVAGLSPETVIHATNDLSQSRAWNRRDPEQRWQMERKAALLRRIVREKLIPLPATA